jgi:hypothetical protein
VVPRAGVEPARPFGQRILSPQRLPFRHPGMLSVSQTIPSLCSLQLVEIRLPSRFGAEKMLDWSIRHNWSFNVQ